MTLRPVLFAALAAVAAIVAPLAHAAEPAANFTLRNLDDPPVSLADYKGKVVFIDFWATWCGPCKDAMPHWQDMHEELGDDGLVVLAITTDDARTKPQVKPFVKRMGYTYTVLYDTESTALVLYNPAKTLPYSVLVGRDFTVRSVHQGYTPGDEKGIEEEVRALLAEPVPGGASPATNAP